MHEAAEQLAQSLLYEGYALYPYTPEATKNATPTPFGIAYPPAYAAGQPAAFDHVQVEVVAEAPDDAEIEAAALFLQAAGSGHEAGERREDLAASVRALVDAPLERSFAHEPGPVSGIARLSAERVGEGRARIRMRVENATPLPEEEAAAMERGDALRRSLLSCHALLGIRGGRFVSPLENEGEVGSAVQACENVNTWPVLAAPDDEAVLGAAYMLPDHPRVAPQSKGNLFDNTEIEEALLLHVHALSDAEREAIAAGDPQVREMVERAGATTPEDLLGLHGVMEPSPEGLLGPVPGPADTAGEETITVDGREFRRGGKVILRPGTEGDPYDRMMDGRAATIQRIYVDYDGKPYLGVTVDDDPMAEVLNESGRYLFFFPDEVEAA